MFSFTLGVPAKKLPVLGSLGRRLSSASLNLPPWNALRVSPTSNVEP